MHTIGMGVVVGINAIFDIRILGFAPAVRLHSLEKFFPVMWMGFWINAITGSILLAVNSTKMTANPDFYVKLAFIALAVINFQMLRKRVFRNVTSSIPVKVLAVTSLFFWLGAITAGRLLAYVGHSKVF